MGLDNWVSGFRTYLDAYLLIKLYKLVSSFRFLFLNLLHLELSFLTCSEIIRLLAELLHPSRVQHIRISSHELARPKRKAPTHLVWGKGGGEGSLAVNPFRPDHKEIRSGSTLVRLLDPSPPRGASSSSSPSLPSSLPSCCRCRFAGGGEAERFLPSPSPTFHPIFFINSIAFVPPPPPVSASASSFFAVSNKLVDSPSRRFFSSCCL